ncbi:MAG: hypothetical protein ACT4OI_06050 [Methanobacteriota archaeon]
MARDGDAPTREPPRKAFRLPASLDMDSLKLDDLEFDLEQEVARLRAEGLLDASVSRPSGR